MHENLPWLFSKMDDRTEAGCRRSSLCLRLAVLTLMVAAMPVASAQDTKRIYLPADAADVVISRIYSSATESANPADQQFELKLEEYGRATRRVTYKRIPSIAVVVQFRSPSQAATRPVLRGAFEENVTSSLRQRIVHFTADLTSRSFKLVPKGRIASMATVEDTSKCWQRSPSWTDFQYSYGCRGQSTRTKVETLAFDVVQN